MQGSLTLESRRLSQQLYKVAYIRWVAGLIPGGVEKHLCICRIIVAESLLVYPKRGVFFFWEIQTLNSGTVPKTQEHPSMDWAVLSDLVHGLDLAAVRF